MKRIVALILVAFLLPSLFSCISEKSGHNHDSTNTNRAESEITALILTVEYYNDRYIAASTCDTPKAHYLIRYDTAKLPNILREEIYVEANTAAIQDKSGTIFFTDPEGADTGEKYSYTKYIEEVNVLYRNGEIDAKPVIYLYPKTETKVTVKIDYNGILTETIPLYRDGWVVTASPDGTLTLDDGSRYPYLFWEGVTNVKMSISEGFCVKGSETEKFFLDLLPRLGLIEAEYREFIEYWLPRMEGNRYNLIQFQTDAYEELAKLEISPEPDAVLRVFMTFMPSEEYVSLPEQSISGFERVGFTVVEWGGREMKN